MASQPGRQAARVKWGLRILAIGYVFFLVAWPTSLIVRQTFARRHCRHLEDALSDPDVVHALQLTAPGGLRAVLINTVFGVGISLLLVRYEFPGKRVLSALIDVPLSVSPDRGRPRAAAGLQRPLRLVRPDARGHTASRSSSPRPA